MPHKYDVRDQAIYHALGFLDYVLLLLDSCHRVDEAFMGHVNLCPLSFLVGAFPTLDRGSF